MPTDAIAVYTFKSRERIYANGGTSSWVLNPVNARPYEWVVCCRNGNDKATEGPEPHGSAFMVARILDFVPSPEKGYEHRYLIRFSEFAEVAIPNAWKGWRNPLKYTTLEELGIDPSTLTFQPMPEVVEPLSEPAPEIELAEDAPFTLTIARAKEGLSNAFGVPREAVEITIRG